MHMQKIDFDPTQHQLNSTCKISELFVSQTWTRNQLSIWDPTESQSDHNQMGSLFQKYHPQIIDISSNSFLAVDN